MGWTTGIGGMVGVRLARYDGAGQWARGDLTYQFTDSLGVVVGVDETGRGLAVPTQLFSANQIHGSTLFASNNRSAGAPLVTTNQAESTTAQVSCRGGECAVGFAGPTAVGGFLFRCR